MADSIRGQNKEKQKNQIRLLQIKKLQEVNKHLKADNIMLIDENKTLVDQCSKLKTLMVAYEKDALYQRLESNVSSQFYVYEVLLTLLIRTIVYL